MTHVTEPEIVVVADRRRRGATTPRDGSRAPARRRGARPAGGRDWATTGGSTPVGIYRRLVAPPLRDSVPWDAVHVWWGDDRYVPRDHPLSNVKPFDDIMLGDRRDRGGHGRRPYPGVPIPVEQRPPVPDRRGDRPRARARPGARRRSPTSCATRGLPDVGRLAGRST